MKEFNFYNLKLVKEKTIEYNKVEDSEDAVEVCRKFLGDKSEEYFIAIGLNTIGQVICGFVISVGELSRTLVHPREIFKKLFAANAYAFIIAHNHPSGCVDFSSEDIECTRRLQECSDILGLKLLDSLVVSDVSYSSASVSGFL